MKLSDAILGILYKHENWAFQPSIVPDHSSFEGSTDKMPVTVLGRLLYKFERAHKRAVRNPFLSGASKSV